MNKLFGVLSVFFALTQLALAGTAPTPEIDPSSGAAAIALLTGGLLVLRSRRKSKVTKSKEEGMRVLGFWMLLVASAGAALALDVVTPEIDPTSGAAALTLLAGGLLVLRSRRK